MAVPETVIEFVLAGTLMPKNYEDEIRDILRGIDGFPGEERSRPAPRRRVALPRWKGFGQIDARKLMGGALILMLFAWIMRGPWSWSFPEMQRVSGYISLVSIVLFVVALVLLFRSGGMGMGMGQPMYREKRWRGQVINMPRRGGLFWTWRRNVERWFSSLRGKNDRRGQKGRDTLRW